MKYLCLLLLLLTTNVFSTDIEYNKFFFKIYQNSDEEKIGIFTPSPNELLLFIPDSGVIKIPKEEFETAEVGNSYSLSEKMLGNYRIKIVSEDTLDYNGTQFTLSNEKINFIDKGLYFEKNKEQYLRLLYINKSYILLLFNISDKEEIEFVKKSLFMKFNSTFKNYGDDVLWFGKRGQFFSLTIESKDKLKFKAFKDTYNYIRVKKEFDSNCKY